MGLEAVNSSKAGTIRSLLIRAWRERWTDLQWGIHIKTILPRCVSGDIYHLADYILQQALMGHLPNNLILSYLKHSLCAQVVSHGGVIESISKYDGFHKPHCVQALLQLLQSMMKSISCRGKPEDCLQLATALVGGVKWLAQVLGWTCQQLLELGVAPEHSNNMSLAGQLLKHILDDDFLMCMMDIGRREEPSLWSECTKKMTEVETLLAGATAVVDNKDMLLNTVCGLGESAPLKGLGVRHVYDCTSVPICYAMHSLVMLEVIMHTTRDAQAFGQQLLMLQQLKGLSVEQLYLELLRCSFLGLSSPDHHHYQELKWVGFTFIKVPAILQHIHNTTNGDTGPSEELVSAIKKLSHLTQLLDYCDTRINCNCLEYLLNELCTSLTLISERDAQAIIADRVAASNSGVSKTSSGLDGANSSSTSNLPGNPYLILRSKPTVNSILKKLSITNQESVLPVMNLLISGKSRDLLLAAAAALGKLHIFAQKFVKFNQLSMDPQPGETSQQAANRALMFDVSFLLLCHIAQLYGIDVVVSDSCETFVEKWMKENMPESGRVKAPLNKIHTDQQAVEEFIRKIEQPESEMKYSMVRWSDACQVAGVTLRECVSAVSQRSGIIQFVKGLLDRMRQHLCCLPLAVATWLCSHVQAVDGSQAAHPVALLQYLQTSINEQDTQVAILDNFKDRSTLMSQIIENMVEVMKGGIHGTSDSNAANNNNSSNSNSSSSNNSNTENGESDRAAQLQFPPNKTERPLSTLLDETWADIFPSGIISHKALGTFRDLLRLGGARWFVADLVKNGMQSVFQSDLTRAIDLIYGILHLDVVGCTLTLLVHAVPLYVSGPLTPELLCEPRTLALSRLTVMMIAAAWEEVIQQQQQQQQQQQAIVKTESGICSGVLGLGAHMSCGSKRSYHDRQLEELEASLQLHSIELAICHTSPELTKSATTLCVALHSLFKLMTQVSRIGVMSPVVQLLVNFLHELVCMPNNQTLLSLTPPALLPNLVPLLAPPNAFTYTHLLAMTAPRMQGADYLSSGLASSSSDLMKDVIGGPTPSQAAGARRAAAKLLCVQRNISLAKITSENEGI